MKKLTILCLLLFAAFVVKAQTADEAIEWLRTKQSTIKRISTNLLPRDGNLKIDDASLNVSSGDKITNIQWGKIKDVRLETMSITIVGDELVDGKNVFIVLMIDIDIAEKYAKALRHLATLKGAKMVKDDMF